MRFREHQPDPADKPAQPAAPGADSLSHRRSQGDAFVAAAEDAIQRALSTDSEAFLNSVEQTGGQ